MALLALLSYNRPSLGFLLSGYSLAKQTEKFLRKRQRCSWRHVREFVILVTFCEWLKSDMASYG
jgi:hypothetical protein